MYIVNIPMYTKMNLFWFRYWFMFTIKLRVPHCNLCGIFSYNSVIVLTKLKTIIMTDIFLKDEGEFVTIGFETEKARKVLYNDNVLKKLYYTIVQGSTPNVDFPVSGIPYVEKFLTENDLTFEEC